MAIDLGYLINGRMMQSMLQGTWWGLFWTPGHENTTTRGFHRARNDKHAAPFHDDIRQQGIDETECIRLVCSYDVANLYRKLGTVNVVAATVRRAVVDQIGPPFIDSMATQAPSSSSSYRQGRYIVYGRKETAPTARPAPSRTRRRVNPPASPTF